MSGNQSIIGSLVPPVALRRRDRVVLRRTIRLTGHHASWADAVADTDGYHDPRILYRVAAAARTVRDGHAAYDHDGVVPKTFLIDRFPPAAVALGDR